MNLLHGPLIGEADASSRVLMGTWGAGIFDDDIACDVRDEFEQLIAEGRDSEDATRQLEKNWEPSLCPDDQSVFWLALAASQTSGGRLIPHVRDRALAIIESGQDLLLAEADLKLRSQREAVLRRLRASLLGEQRPPTKIAKRPRHDNQWPVGTILIYELGRGRLALFRVTRHHTDRGGRYAWVEVLEGTYDRLPSEILIALSSGRKDYDGRYFELFLNRADERSDRLTMTTRGRSLLATIARRLRIPPAAARDRAAIVPTKALSIDGILATYLHLDIVRE